MKKVTAFIAALIAMLLPAAAYADVVYPGEVSVFGENFNIIPLIIVLVVITIARAIIVKAVRKKKEQEEK